MATIPLPALHTAPIEQPTSPLAMMGQMMGIKNAQQEQAQREAMAPLEQQRAQEQVQSGQLELQQQQQAMKDQQTFRQAMQAPENSGKTIGDLADTLVRQGALSMQGWQQMKKADVEQRMQNATLTETQLKNYKETTGQLANIYNNAMAMKPDEFASAWPTLLQQISHIPGVQQMKLDPSQPMTQDQLSHIGPFLQMHNQYLDEELARRQKQTELQTSQATLGQKQAESQFYQQNGGAPGVSADLMQQADWLKKNPGKGPSDYLVWKAQHSPTMIMNNLANGAATAPGMQAPGGGIDWNKVAQHYGLTSQAFDQQAEQAGLGKFPPIGRSANGIAMNRDLMNRYAELHPDASIAQNSAEYKANSESLKKLQTNVDQVSAFENTALKNMDLLQQTAAKIPDLGTRFANVPVRMISGVIIGTDNQAAFKTALNTAQTEAAKVLNSSNASGVLSDSARHELQDLVDGNMTYSALTSSLNTLKQDMHNRHAAYQDQINFIQGRLRPASAQQPGGGGTGLSVTAGGKTFTFKDQAALDAFKKEAGIQ